LNKFKEFELKLEKGHMAVIFSVIHVLDKLSNLRGKWDTGGLPATQVGAECI
jgi:hypothetical protein